MPMRRSATDGNRRGKRPQKYQRRCGEAARGNTACVLRIGLNRLTSPTALRRFGACRDGANQSLAGPRLASAEGKVKAAAQLFERDRIARPFSHSKASSDLTRACAAARSAAHAMTLIGVSWIHQTSG